MRMGTSIDPAARRYRGPPRAALAVVVACGSVALSCGSGHHAAVSGGAREARLTSSSEEGQAHPGQKVNEAQLQDELQRFTGQLVDRIAQAAQDATVADP